MSYKPYKPGKALLYSVLIWLIGFFWGTLVFMTPALMDLQSIPYISKYPAISFPLIAAYFIIGCLLARDYLGGTDKKAAEGLRFGVLIFLVNFILDVLIYFILFNSKDYFAYFSIWFSYIMFIAYPWLIGLWFERKKGTQR
ncbi:MAG: hypothetical protein FIB07_14505 [Candidatus Methanoperedens sp.]|nr:hypothetical protein [Candidatus Methanoperedens sp.]